MLSLINGTKLQQIARCVRVNNIFRANEVSSICRTRPVELLCKRNASIHTRNILVQKLKLEHVTNFGITLLVFPVIGFGLGVWQIQRKLQKEKLIVTLKRQFNAEPVEIPEDLALLNTMEYTVVKLRGEFVHDEEIHLGPRTFIKQGKGAGGMMSFAPKSGYLIITPFKLEGRDEKILVNRGWVPKNQISSAARQEGQPSGVIEFTGIVRKHENRPQFMPKMPEKGRYFAYRDVNRMSRMTGAEPYLVDATTQAQVPGGPIGGQTMITVRNEHLSYIFTWFSLSGLTGYFWYRLVYLIPK